MMVWLLTWLWQGLALTLAMTLLLRLPGLNAATRYLVWWSVLGAVIWLGWMSSPGAGLAIVQSGATDAGRTLAPPEPLFRVNAAPPFLISTVLGVWAAIALMKLVRLLPALHAVYALRDRCRPFPADLESRLPLWLETKAQGRRANLSVCDAVPGATVFGLQRPCIALPSSLVAALAAEEIDQVVLHEHAHVRRRDDWARLVQLLLQAALWIHPAVALIGRALNREREMACDDWVVARTGLPKAYAQCLAHAAEVRGRTWVESALLPALTSRQRDVVHRVSRLLAVKGKTRRNASLMVLAASVFMITGITLHLNAVALVGEAAEPHLPRIVAPLARMAAVETPLPAFTVPVLRASAQAPLPSNLRIQEPYELGASEANEPDELHEPDEPANAPVSALSARSFEGLYRSDVAAPADSGSTIRWSAAAAPGLAVAEAARKTGVGLAGAFSRASVALARSF